MGLTMGTHAAVGNKEKRKNLWNNIHIGTGPQRQTLPTPQQASFGK